MVFKNPVVESNIECQLEESLLRVAAVVASDIILLNVCINKSCPILNSIMRMMRWLLVSNIFNCSLDIKCGCWRRIESCLTSLFLLLLLLSCFASSGTCVNGNGYSGARVGPSSSYAHRDFISYKIKSKVNIDIKISFNGFIRVDK